MNSKTFNFLLILISFSALRIYLGLTRFFLLAEPSDHIEYLAPLAFDSLDYQSLAFYGSSMLTKGWLWVDRLAFGSGLGMIYNLPIDKILAAPIYANLVLVLTQLVGMYWLFKNSNLYSVILFGILFNTSSMINSTGSQALPESTLMLYSLLAFASAFPDIKDESKCYPILAGIFATCCCMSKATGVCVPAFIGIYFLLKLRKVIPRFILGLFSGAIIVCILFSIFVSLETLLYTIKSLYAFFGSNFHGRRNYNNFVSYIEVFFALDKLPFFAFLLISAGAMRLKETRLSFLYAWSFIIIIYAIYYITLRGYIPKPRYIFPAVGISAFCMSHYLGYLMEKHLGAFKSTKISLTLLVVCLLLILGGFYLGDTYSPSGIFKPQMLDNYPRVVGAFYGLGALVLLLYLLSFEIKPTKYLLLSFPLFLSLWAASFPGGVATKYVQKYKAPKVEEFYERAKLPLEIPERDVDIYIDKWKGNARLYRVAYIYHIFFETWPAKNESGLEDKQRHRIKFFHELSAMITKGKAPLVLTDKPELLEKAYGRKLELHRELEWEGLELGIYKL